MERLRWNRRQWSKIIHLNSKDFESSLHLKEFVLIQSTLTLFERKLCQNYSGLILGQFRKLDFLDEKWSHFELSGFKG
jgi:hypothetical protein